MDRFEELQTLVAVVDAGSFSAAAERLGLARSAVSRRIAELEARLGAQLLHRTTRRLSLTGAGQQYYERGVRLLADLDEAEQVVISGQAALRGRLRLAAPLSFGLLHLAPVVDRLLAAHPELVLDLDLNDRQVNLVEEGFDLALRIGQLADSNLVARRLAPVRFLLCASPDYLRRHGEPSTPQALAGHPGLVYGNIPESQQWSFVDGAGHSVSVRLPTRLRANNGDLLLQAALDGVGVAALPTFLCHRAVAEGRLRALLTDYRLPASALYAVYPSRRHTPARLRLLLGVLSEVFTDPPYWEQGLDPLAR